MTRDEHEHALRATALRMALSAVLIALAAHLAGLL